MPRKNSYITVKDQFCGSGGSSQGARAAGAEIKVALNHWKLAIETHNTNFPEAMHDCTDISASDPRRYPSTDILITSPECTNHSLAKGVKIVKKQIDMFASGKMDPAAERSRATMWDVPRFAEFHNYNAIIVENVVDARKWIMFDAWLQAMYALGYLHRCTYHNSQHHHPTPQSRDRMYVIFWKKGNKPPKLDYTPAAYCPRCEKVIHAVQTWKRPDVKYGKYKQQYVYCCPVDGAVVEPYYYASFNCIDWSDPGTRIGDRAKPLAPNSVIRIQYGIDKYGDKPMIVVNYTPGYCKPVNEPTATMTTRDSHGILIPFIVNLEYSQRKSNIKPTSMPMAIQITRQSAMVVRHDMISADGIHTGIVTQGSFNSFISSYYSGSNCTKHITEPTGTVTTGDRLSLINFKKPNIEDCYYRMLKPAEIKLAMAFEPDYVVLGNSRDQVKQLGNAVTPPVMEWLVRQVIQSLS